MQPADRYPAALLAAFSVIWIALAIFPWYRQDWLLENVIVLVAVPITVWLTCADYARLLLTMDWRQAVGLPWSSALTGVFGASAGWALVPLLVGASLIALPVRARFATRSWHSGQTAWWIGIGAGPSSTGKIRLTISSSVRCRPLIGGPPASGAACAPPGTGGT